MPKFIFKSKVYNNPVEFALHFIGNKWKMPILFRLNKHKYRYGELKRSLDPITHKMLTQQLRELEQDGFVKRKLFNQIPLKVEYSITALGKSVNPAIEALRQWGNYLKTKKIKYPDNQDPDI